MTRQPMTRVVAALLGAGATMMVTAQAHAAVDCATLPTPTYVTGSSASKPLMAAIGKALSGKSTVVYKGQGSCTGVDAMVNGTKITGTASYWDAMGMEQTCNLSATGDAADIGVSDVFSSTCPGFGALPNTLGDFFGPNQVMTFVVPSASSQTNISAEAAYFVFGFGAAAGMVDPWTVDANVQIRSATSGTQAMIGTAIKVPADKWKGTSNAKSGDLLNAVAMSAAPESTIGILAADVADPNRSKVKILAYQHFGQKCGYWPDSSASSFDKMNVRDGHYPIWGPLHFFAKIDANKKPTNVKAGDLIDYVQGKQALPGGASMLDLEIDSHTVPDCAMQVSRATEIGDLMSYMPTKSCGCYFENRANGKTTCNTCKIDGDCKGAAKHCNYGFCEAN